MKSLGDWSRSFSVLRKISFPWQGSTVHGSFLDSKSLSVLKHGILLRLQSPVVPRTSISTISPLRLSSVLLDSGALLTSFSSVGDPSPEGALPTSPAKFQQFAWPSRHLFPHRWPQAPCTHSPREWERLSQVQCHPLCFDGYSEILFSGLGDTLLPSWFPILWSSRWGLVFTHSYSPT